jgi:hypothetical protein
LFSQWNERQRGVLESLLLTLIPGNGSWHFTRSFWPLPLGAIVAQYSPTKLSQYQTSLDFLVLSFNTVVCA